MPEVIRENKLPSPLSTNKMNKDFFNDSDNSRDGYRSHGDNNGARGNRYGNDRPARPRFTRNSQSFDNGGYQPRNSEGGYRPRYDGEGGQRSSYNRGEGGYGQRQQGGYRPRFQNGGEGGYRQGGNRPQRPGYGRGEGGNSYGRTGGYGQGAGRGEGGYRQGGNQRPRFQGGNGGNQPRPRTNGYDPHAKYSHKKRLEYKEENYDPTVPIRLNKYLANAGVCSRRDADKYIEAGVVSVNGVVVTELGAKVLRTDEVKFHDNTVKIEKKVYVLLNKPKGYVTTSEDPQNRKTVMDLVQKACMERIYPVGRLDRNTTGVLLLTNDGEMASKLTHPKFLKKKIYHVTTDRNVSATDMRQIAEGIMLDDGEIKADEIEYASPTDKKEIGIEIHSGKNRIVRRIFESLGYHVVKLDRVYFAGLTKKNVRRGDWRYLTEKEVQMLRMGAYE